MKFISLFSLFTLIFTSCGISAEKSNASKDSSMSNNPNIPSSSLDTAVLAGGCFWCLDAVYRRMDGIVESISGYSNGTVKNPSYREVCTGTTGHAEVVKLVFDPSKTSYAEILEVFWRIHNPTTLNRQGNDIGTQYRSGIYYLNEEQKKLAEQSRDAAAEAKLWDGTIVTEILPLENFYVAEDYHQDYFTNNPNQPYCVYVVGEKVDKFKKLFADKMKK